MRILEFLDLGVAQRFARQGLSVFCEGGAIGGLCVSLGFAVGVNASSAHVVKPKRYHAVLSQVADCGSINKILEGGNISGGRKIAWSQEPEMYFENYGTLDQATTVVQDGRAWKFKRGVMDSSHYELAQSVIHLDDKSHKYPKLISGRITWPGTHISDGYDVSYRCGRNCEDFIRLSLRSNQDIVSISGRQYHLYSTYPWKYAAAYPLNLRQSYATLPQIPQPSCLFVTK